MAETSEELREVRSRICNMILASSAIFAIPAVSASVYRLIHMDWQWMMAGHIAAAAAIWLLLAFRKTLPYTIRAGAIIGIFFILGLVGFWNFGMVAGANPLILATPVMATILFGKRVGVLCAVFVVLAMVLTAFSFIFGGRVFTIDFTVAPKYLPTWITYLFVVIMSMAASIAAISMSNHHLAAALDKSKQSEKDLSDLNRDLESQVLERTQELHEAIKYAEHQARTDALTGLNNRRAFLEYAEVIDVQARRYEHSYAIAMIDIDHFKAVNDTWGHDTGDVALKSVGQIITATLRETDIIGRIGGEEFAVIMPETKATAATTLVERLRMAIEQASILTPKGKINLTASIGVALFKDHNAPLAKVISNADAALYVAKNEGRNKIKLHQ